MSKTNKNKTCKKCGDAEEEKKEIYRDEDKNDAYYVVSYFLYYCEHCGPEERKLAELDYWKKLAIPDLK